MTYQKLSEEAANAKMRKSDCALCVRHHVPNETTRKALASGSEDDLAFASAADAFAYLKAMIFPSHRPMFAFLVGITLSFLPLANIEFVSSLNKTTMHEEKAIAKPSMCCLFDSINKIERIVLRE